MPFHSILAPHPNGLEAPSANQPPQFFRDLNLDQIVDDITAGKTAYNLKPLYCSPLHDVASVRYRQAVIRDLDADSGLLGSIKTFALGMSEVRTRLEQKGKARERYHREGYVLEAILAYCNTVTHLGRALTRLICPLMGLLLSESL